MKHASLGADQVTKRYARRDSNHGAVRDALRAEGWTVLDLADLGGGAPDLLVGAGDVLVLIEVKDGEKPPSKRRLTPDEAAWHSAWNGRVFIAETAREAVAIVRREVDERV